MALHPDLRHDIDMPFLRITHNVQDILLNAEAELRLRSISWLARSSYTIGQRGELLRREPASVNFVWIS